MLGKPRLESQVTGHQISVELSEICGVRKKEKIYQRFILHKSFNKKLSFTYCEELPAGLYGCCYVVEV